jgi:hypothetical protein
MSCLPRSLEFEKALHPEASHTTNAGARTCVAVQRLRDRPGPSTTLLSSSSPKPHSDWLLTDRGLAGWRISRVSPPMLWNLPLLGCALHARASFDGPTDCSAHAGFFHAKLLVSSSGEPLLCVLT